MRFALFLLGFLLAGVIGLRFDIEALDQSAAPQCVRDFVAEGSLVVVTVESSGYKGDGQVLDLKITDSVGNELRSKKDLDGNVKVAFTAHTSAAFDVCLHNTKVSRSGSKLFRQIDLEIESGASARDWNAVQANEKLKPMEVELRKVEQVTDEIVQELDYLKAREERLRDTNESTNRRVRNFSICIVILLVSLGVWQVNYLKNFFKSKHIL